VLLPSVASALTPLLSVASALAPLLSVVNAQKPPLSVVPPPRPLLSEVTAVVPHLLPTDVKALAALKHVSLLAPPIDVPVLQDPIAPAVQAVPNKHPVVSRDAEPPLKLLLHQEEAHRGPAE